MARNDSKARGHPITLRNNLASVDDIQTRDALQEIQDAWHQHPFLRAEVEIICIEVTSAGTSKHEHCLPFEPRQMWVVYTEKPNDVTINYSSITENSFEMTTTASGQVEIIAMNHRKSDTRR